MRKFLAFMLLASAATAPALAAGEPGDHRGFHHDSSSQSSDNNKSNNRSDDRPHVNRSDNGGNAGSQQPQQQHREVPMVRIQPNSGGGGGDNNGGERRHFNGFVNRSSGGGEQPVIQQNGDAAASVRNWRSEERRHINTGPKIVEPTTVGTEPATRDLRDTHRLAPKIFRNRVPIISNTPHEGTQPPLRTERRRTQSVNWNTSHWRNDHRYNWQDWRRRHRSTFHLGLYFDPFGWGYQPYQIGWRLWPNYYNSNYWLSDPYEYRLPYAPPGYRWIRYYDDAILVDTWNGQVVDVIYNFFW